MLAPWMMQSVGSSLLDSVDLMRCCSGEISLAPHFGVNPPPSEAPEPSEMPLKAKFIGVKLETWDCISAGISFLCLVVILVFLINSKYGDNMGRHRVDINREMLMYSNNATFVKHMRFMQRGYTDYCRE